MGERALNATEPPGLAQYSFQLNAANISPSSLPAGLTGVKAKRRRTSPQDHAILEAAYQRNSKPDKVQRAQVVNQVSLGEKEVQIWFQNRRQNDRRRSKPLEPHELVAHLSNNTASAVPVTHLSPSPPPQAQITASLAPVEPIHRPSSRASSINDLLNPTPSAENSPSHSTQDTSNSVTPSSSFEDNAVLVKTAAVVGNQEDKLQDAGRASEDGSQHGSAKKRNHDEMTGIQTPKSDLNELKELSGTEAPCQVKEPLTRTSSFVRLAMTVDGAVKVSRSKDDTPSPEKPRPAAPNTQVKVKTPMIRSKSAVSGVEVYRDGLQGAGPRSVGAGFGRSRDARTWEFYCDSKTKDALSTQAEAETAGSAVSAINLIRSNSFKSRSQALSPSVTKTNAHTMPSKRGKPGLSRAKSSLGRLQGLDDPAEPCREKPKAARGHVRSASGDSDKENWAPGTRTSEHDLRRTGPSGSQRPILQENEEMTFPDASSSRKCRDERPDSRVSPTKVKAKGEEMDCVQGLLSLSQGAWTMK